MQEEEDLPVWRQQPGLRGAPALPKRTLPRRDFRGQSFPTPDGDAPKETGK